MSKTGKHGHAKFTYPRTFLPDPKWQVVWQPNFGWHHFLSTGTSDQTFELSERICMNPKNFRPKKVASMDLDIFLGVGCYIFPKFNWR